MLDVKILGPLDARNGDHEVTPSAAKPRQLLTLLALESGRVVSAATIVDELWGGRPPRSALTTMQTYILQLRRCIVGGTLGGPIEDASARRAVKEVLATRTGGYSLNIDASHIDSRVFDSLVRRGGHAFQEGEWAAASQLLRSALELWRGPAMVDVEVGDVLSVDLARLNESRLVTLEQVIEAEMQLGKYRSLLSELAELASRYPLHENFAGQYIVVLYRAGRRSQALAAYSRLCTNLGAELGVAPSARLQQLHSAVLTSEPALDEPNAGGRLLDQLAG
ncbi:DNA-binding SARP family transcriptional activator [Nocardia alba]|uniref:DNA-binding SARP family transcriptional activator n=1 Tax=Nocardia alba TaxID=225051 RepID=A0A4R1FAT6_9NOCA|nr:DNA-binding SARP family transcriptional activator [Nocardia alba]